ncbi:MULTISPECIES: phage repressor protein/antirepressor Ant [Bacillus cereus group]|uniref:Phage repressor protein/antirepressor Ant n=2 Tax=Bacillus thuringiensis TaxID=1428 RepID=A0A9Q5SJF2_BACTU|nr:MULTISPECIES: phage repressor protein/antirepressor Ant [Bacillus cereus group]EEM55626.1 Phage antirepressor protein [Bacillus thuringiensis serovar monterrey BGSC 4AJ1]MEB9673390.1 phage repressor protein/antirepressor Ant [Bacillus anthracis]OTW54569.1 phage repressor protein/antirepressor Ant [Bacillus thuringiensis serovar mexicanensis]OTX01603.1 phage repressor protein/antirepressor Ant [Bacillus thuringiensis serovar monterrey]OTX51235.1 phage repressor protein/antirepressor Ant [Bac
MNKLQVFNNEELGQVRTVVKGEDVWFVAKDVCEVLEIKNTTQAMQKLDPEERTMFNIGRQGETNIINESGLYSLIMTSRKPQAKAFKKWVTSEVLPSIRKHGSYMTDQVLEQAVTNPDFMIGLLTNLKEEKAKRVEAERTILQQQPLVTFAEAVQVSTNLITVKQLANLMRQKGIDTGQNRLFEWFRENGYLCKKKGSLYNTPTQYSMDLELFESQEYVRTNSQGEFVTSFTTKVTGKGQLYFINKFLGKEAV